MKKILLGFAVILSAIFGSLLTYFELTLTEKIFICLFMVFLAVVLSLIDDFLERLDEITKRLANIEKKLGI